MMRVRALAAIVLFVFGIAVAEQPTVTIVSPCECPDAHGTGRWAVKTDSSLPPADASAIQAVVPSNAFSWPGTGEPLTQQSERAGIENKWLALTGRVVAVKVEADGDLHIALQDATGNGIGTVSAEILVGPAWCEIRQIVFSWTTQSFPFSLKTAKKLKIREPHIITVTGKALYDISHAPADHSNRRNHPKDYAV